MSPEASSNNDSIYVTHVTTSESEGEHQDPSFTNFDPEYDQY